MLEFIKMFGLGVLYTILFPFIVIIFAIFLVYAFFNYLVVECISLFGFFFGYTFSIETDLEKKLEEMNNQAHEEKNEEEPTVAYQYDDSFQHVENASDMRGSDEQ